MSDLLNLFLAYQNTTVEDTQTLTCSTGIDHYQFYSWLMLPASLCTIFLAFFVRRTHRCTDKLDGRPGLVYPLNLFTKKDRLSVAAVFGSIAFLCSEVIFEAKYTVPFSGEVWLRLFVILLSVVMYGIAYFPVFAGLALRALPGYGVATLFSWMYAGINLYQTFQCDWDWETQLILITRDLPKLVCCVFLAVSLPLKFGKELYRLTHLKNRVSAEPLSYWDRLEAIRESENGRHIRNLFIPPPPPQPPREGCIGTIKNILMPIIHNWLYHRHPNFTYSARILAIVCVSFMLVYKLTVDIMIVFIPYLKALQHATEDLLTAIGWIAILGESTETAGLRNILYIVWNFIDVFIGCLATACCLSFLVGLVMLLHTLSSYRTNLLALYKGDHTFIPGRDVNSPTSLMLGTMRYTGYQVGYTAWAYVFQWLIFFLLTFALATIIELIRLGYGYLFVNLIRALWPIPLTTIFMMIAQILMTRFLFVQERGAVLAIENRRCFFVVSYFMFFYNIFMGLFSCLLRILKAIGIGALFLGRLDNSTLPRKFEFLDPGFNAYLGFIHLENCHLNPVMLTFLDILNLNVMSKTVSAETDSVEMMDIEAQTKVKDEGLRRAQAAFRWHIAYSLLRNPMLRTKRKSYLDSLKQKTEQYHEQKQKQTPDKIKDEKEYEEHEKRKDG